MNELMRHLFEYEFDSYIIKLFVCYCALVLYAFTLLNCSFVIIHEFCIFVQYTSKIKNILKLSRRITQQRVVEYLNLFIRYPFSAEEIFLQDFSSNSEASWSERKTFKIFTFSAKLVTSN